MLEQLGARLLAQGRQRELEPVATQHHRFDPAQQHPHLAATPMWEHHIGANGLVGLIAFSFIFWGVDFGMTGATTFAAAVQFARSEQRAMTRRDA